MTASCFLPSHKAPVPVDLVSGDQIDDYLGAQSEYAAAILKSEAFCAGAGECVRLPDMTGNLSRIVFGLGKNEDPLGVAKLSASLKGGVFQLDFVSPGHDLLTLAIGWADGAYAYTRYKPRQGEIPQLVLRDKELFASAEKYNTAIRLLRDLVNTPAQDMGPSQLQAEIEAVAKEFKAKVSVTIGDDLIGANYPMVHAVGRAALDPPRVIELEWGKKKDPTLALVGKGITFDTGGLDLKTGGFMRQMKKDMGGSAHAIALARLVMSHKLPVHLKLIVPAAENAIGAGAFRPGDVLDTRKGITVEIDNTDAEGRLVLGDALTRAQEEDEVDLMIDFATLTGAARVAMGPEVAPFYTDDDELAAAIGGASSAVSDPAWRLPLWKPYMSLLQSSIADCQNAASGPMAGSITAALFLSKFVETKSWVHWDVWAWREAKYGNPQGGAAQGLRAMFEVLKNRYG